MSGLEPGAGPGVGEELTGGHQPGSEPGDTGSTVADTGPDESHTGDTAGDTPRESSRFGQGSAPGDADRRAAASEYGARAPRSYDWPSIKRRYVEGVKADDAEAGVMTWPTLDQVASHFEVTANRVREKSAMDGWVEERNRWQAQVEATRRQARAAGLARSATELDGKALNTAQLGLQLVETRMREIAQLAQRRRSEGAGLAGAPGTGIDAQEMQRLGQAADLLHKIGLRAIGDPQLHRVEISGPNGRPLEIAHELRRDDPARISGVLSVLRSAGLGDLFGVGDDPGGEAPGYGRADGDQAALPARS